MKQTIMDIIRRYGYRGFLLNVMQKLLEALGIHLSFKVCYALTSAVIPKTDARQDTLVRELSYSDFAKQVELNPTWFGASKMECIRQAFEIHGNRAYGCFDGDLLIAYGWISTEQWGLDSRKLKSTDGYLWDDYTHPAYRGKKLHGIITSHRVACLSAVGKTRYLSLTDAFNRASRVGFARCGFHVLERYCDYSFFKSSVHTTSKYEKL